MRTFMISSTLCVALVIVYVFMTDTESWKLWTCSLAGISGAFLGERLHYFYSGT